MIENFKGIEFVRISSLPEEQKEKIWQSALKNKVIKIVRDQSLLNDCILYQDYASWLSEQPIQSSKTPTSVSPPRQTFSKLAFK